MTERQGRLKSREIVLKWTWHWDAAGDNRYFYAEAGSPVRWDGVSSNAGYEDFYGGRRLLWTEVWLDGYDEVSGWMSKGLEEDEVEWDADSD